MNPGVSIFGRAVAGCSAHRRPVLVRASPRCASLTLARCGHHLSFSVQNGIVEEAINEWSNKNGNRLYENHLAKQSIERGE
jgi:hypothetical protein